MIPDEEGRLDHPPARVPVGGPCPDGAGGAAVVVLITRVREDPAAQNADTTVPISR